MAPGTRPAGHAELRSEARPGRAELVERLRAQGTRYHNLHPFHVRMDAGELTREELQRWVANRFYYQECIPLKDAAILSNCPEVEVRREWISRIIDHDGTADGHAAGSSRGCASARRSASRARSSCPSATCCPAVRYAVDAYVDFARRKPGSRRSRRRSRSCSGRARSRSASPRSSAHYPWIDPAGLQYFRDRLVLAPRDARVRARPRRRALPDARAAGPRRRRAAIQDRDAVGAARGDRARRHATAGRA